MRGVPLGGRGGGADGAAPAPAAPQLTRPAQDLLMSVCMNCGTHGPEDMDVISHLIKIRLKPKVLLNHYMLCIRCARRGGAGGGGRQAGAAQPLQRRLLGPRPGSC